MRFAKFLVYLSILTLSSMAGFSQIPPNPNTETGFKPFGSYQGGGIDSVSLSNGNLIVHARLFCYPQRGIRSLCFSISYNNKGYIGFPFDSGGHTAYMWMW